MELDHLKRALFCRHCNHLDIMNGHIDCANDRGCDCKEEIEQNTILDVFANLYYHMNNINLSQYEDIVNENAPTTLEIHSQLSGQWKKHLVGQNPKLYKEYRQIELTDKTRQMIRESIEIATTNQELLIHIMEWLLILDGNLRELRFELAGRRKGEPLVQTSRGPLIFRCNSYLAEFLENQNRYEPPHNSNYLQLQRKLENFHLANDCYKNYNIVNHRHLHLPIYDHNTVGGVQFGFFAGKFDVFNDYQFDIAETTDRNGYLPFAFTGVKDRSEYYKTVSESFSCLLNQNPEFILLPEFMTPFDLQEQLKAKLKERFQQREAQAEPHKTQVLLTGSFHVTKQVMLQDPTTENPNRLYNYAQAVNGQGEKFLDLFKMNKFIFYRSEKNVGDLKPFQDCDGVERNSYTNRNLILFETTLGRMAFLICVDFINDDVIEILVDRHVDLLFVMTMTPHPNSGTFKRYLQTLGEKTNAMIVLCNHLGKPTVVEKDPRIVIYVPGFKQMYVSEQEKLVCSLHDILKTVNPEPVEKVRQSCDLPSIGI